MTGPASRPGSGQREPANASATRDQLAPCGCYADDPGCPHGRVRAWDDRWSAPATWPASPPRPLVAVYLCTLCDQRSDGLGETETDRLADARQRHWDATAELALHDHEPDFLLVAGPADHQGDTP